MVMVLISALLGGLLLLAGVPKVRNREGRLAAVQGYRVLPEAGERLVAHALPYAEILLGVLLVLGLGAPVVPALAAALFFVFFVGLSVNLLRGRRELDCGCFAFANGEGRVPRISWFHAGRAVVLAALAAALLLAPGGYGIGTTPIAEYLLGLALAVLVFTIGLAVVAVRGVVHPGRRAVDVQLSAALRAVSTAPRS
jgi:Methylamine utilisation protein MauE